MASPVPRLAASVFVCAAISFGVARAEPVCGGKDQAPCGPQPATFVGPASSCKAYPDSFWDPRNGGECWSCPKDFIRSLKPVTDAAACMQPLNGVGYTAAKYVQKSACPAGSFLDLRNGGECWSCPDGSTRTTAKVTEWNACVAEEDYKPATRYGQATGLLHTTCPTGQFWDPNGYCWSCPTDYKRSVYPVTGDKACFKTGKVNLFATLLGPRCPNSFWDPRNGGECWSCPVGYIRDAFAVTDPKACITTAAKVATATYQGKWACAKGDVWDPKLVSNGEGGMVASCWHCPDQTKRSIFPVDGPKACASPSFMWHTPDYREPGLFGLASPTSLAPVANVLVDLFSDAAGVKGFTGFLYGYRAGKGDTGAALDASVAQEWALVVQDPSSSAALKAYLYAYLATIASSPRNLTAHEGDLIAAWEKYVRDRRIYVAQDARNAYEAWKLADAWAREKQAELEATYGVSNMTSLFDYGRVPPKFADIAEANLKQGFAQAGGTVAAVGVLGTPAVVNSAQLTKFLLPFRRAPATFGGLGPQIIVMVAIIIGEIAIDQVIDINTMDARLKSTLELASRPFSLSAKLGEAQGNQQMMAAWATATAPSAPVGMIPPAVALAASKARATAAAAGYWASELR